MIFNFYFASYTRAKVIQPARHFFLQNYVGSRCAIGQRLVQDLRTGRTWRRCSSFVLLLELYHDDYVGHELPDDDEDNAAVHAEKAQHGGALWRRAVQDLSSALNLLMKSFFLKEGFDMLKKKLTSVVDVSGLLSSSKRWSEAARKESLTPFG